MTEELQIESEAGMGTWWGLGSDSGAEGCWWDDGRMENRVEGCSRAET